ncbi:hypothetical protein Tco_1456886 [Tanacetum coccineum]
MTAHSYRHGSEITPDECPDVAAHRAFTDPSTPTTPSNASHRPDRHQTLGFKPSIDLHITVTTNFYSRNTGIGMVSIVSSLKTRFDSIIGTGNLNLRRWASSRGSYRR